MTAITLIKEAKEIRKRLQAEHKKVVFTNGCFDILHSGHVDYLTKAKALGDFLIVGLNSNSSIKSIKGEKRPIIDEEERAFILHSLKPVDLVVLFNEDTPAEIINELVPDILVKGADWAVENIVGREVVEANGGEVKTIKFVNNQSTSQIIDSIIEKYCK